MEKLPNEVLLAIISYIPLKQRLQLRRVSSRWCTLALDSSLLRHICISDEKCTDQQLQGTFSVAKRLEKVDLFGCRALYGSCLLSAQLNFLSTLNLARTLVTDAVLVSVLQQCGEELRELNISGTQLSKSCVPEICHLKKIESISFPPEDEAKFDRQSVIKIVKSCPTLRTLDCQEGYFFSDFDIENIIGANRNLKVLIIPYGFVTNEVLNTLSDRLPHLRYVCVCFTDVDRAGVERVQRRHNQLEICWEQSLADNS